MAGLIRKMFLALSRVHSDEILKLSQQAHLLGSPARPSFLSPLRRQFLQRTDLPFLLSNNPHAPCELLLSDY